MKYYIPTSSLNFNNILSTESLSPKAFYDKRGFGYSRWFTVEENCIEHITLLYGTPHTFERPMSDIEDHPMLLEIDTDETYPQLTEDIFYTDRTIYLNPWQTKFIFFNKKDRTTTMSLSDSSLETKLVRLYQRKIHVLQFEGTYPIVQVPSSLSVGDMNKYVEDDYIINKMKGLLYGYYIGANFSSTKEYVQKLDTLREIQNIFSSVLSSYDRVPSNIQRNRLNQLFDFLDSLQPIYIDLEKEIGNKQLVDRIFNIFRQHGYIFTSVDRTKLIYGLQSDGENNQSVAWVNREISHAKTLMESYVVNLDPDEGEIIISSKDKVVAQKAITDSLLASLFLTWTNDVLCSKSFNGKINSIKEILSDEITKSAKNVIGVEWDNSPVRTYLNQLRRHVRGEEFNQVWDNGLLSSISAVLIKGDEWEQLLKFMQSKGMYDYRIAFAFYGVLNGFANLTRDFTDLILNKESNYVSKVYREMYGQLHEKSIPVTLNISSDIEQKDYPVKENDRSSVLQNDEKKALEDWQNGIRTYAVSVIKRDKQKLLTSLDEALVQNGNNQDYYAFVTILKKFDGWKPTKNGPCAAWKRIQEHFVPSYCDQRIDKPIKKQSSEKTERGLFDGLMDGLQHATQTIKSVLSGDNEAGRLKKDMEQDSSISEGQSNLRPINATSANFVDDINADNFILSRSYLPNEVREVLAKKIISFQKDYAPNGYYYGREDSPRTNNNTIKHFINKCTFTKGNNPSWIPSTIENKALLERLKQELFDRYANR
ncbi:MAG: hypothetical protein IKB39_04155 [Bacteroidaceae bacterium]|nr:hypothetical protein [Bacteroidaceae bacterium]